MSTSAILSEQNEPSHGGLPQGERAKRQRGPQRKPLIRRLPRPLTVLWFIVFGIVLFFTIQDYGVKNQLLLGMTAVAILLILRTLRLAQSLRLFFIFIAALISLRYLNWRVSETLPELMTWSFIPGVMLFTAEAYGILMHFLGLFVNIAPIDRKKAPLPADPECLPSVDVMVPSYNEEPELLEVTLRAAKLMRYPEHKLRVYLLDDGGTEQKRNDADPAKANAAEERHRTLLALCERLRCGYRTRARNEHAKAGNINSALSSTAGELVLIIDADHIPTHDFLENTVGHFAEDPDLFMVQTPHFFLNPDPVERNLGTFERMPSENEMFYCVGQRGLDRWDASFFCGSAALLRRRCLEEVGGIQGNSITEDAETALELHARGYRSLYVSTPMIAGLSPETFVGFIGQRTRWAQGMLQILLLKRPLFKSGLSIAQRLSYTASSVYWLFPIARLLFLLTPLSYLIFGLQIFEASFDEFLAYAAAHLVCSLMVSNFLFGRVRWPFISEVYEVAQSVYLTPALLSVFGSPRAPTFKVTAKAETLERSFVSTLYAPLAGAFALLLAAELFGIWRYWAFPLERENALIVLSINSYNLLFLLASLGIVYERAQRRQLPRVPLDLPGVLCNGDQALRVAVEDLTTRGARVVAADAPLLDQLLSQGQPELSIGSWERDEGRMVPVEIRQAHSDEGTTTLGLKFRYENDRQIDLIVSAAYGSSALWQDFQKRRQNPRSLLGGFLHFVWLAFSRGIVGLYHIILQHVVALPKETRRAALNLPPEIGNGQPSAERTR